MAYTAAGLRAPALSALVCVLGCVGASGAARAAAGARGSSELGVDVYRARAAEPGNILLAPPALVGQLAALQMARPPDPRRPPLEVREADPQWTTFFATAPDVVLLPAGRTAISRGYRVQFLSAHDDVALVRVLRRGVAQIYSYFIDAPPALRSGELLIVGAQAWRGTLAIPFDSALTQTEPFFTAADQPTPVAMMHRRAATLVRRLPTHDLVVLPYAADGATLHLLVPRRRFDLARVEKALDAAQELNDARAAEPQDVELALPRFSFASTLPLRRTLARVDLAAGFCSDAPAAQPAPLLPRLSAGPLCAAELLHAMAIDVDERGAMAAGAAGADRGAPAVLVRADQPFVFLVRGADGAIEVIGRVTDPAALATRGVPP